MTNVKITQPNKLDKKYRYSEIFGNTIQGEGKKKLAYQRFGIEL